MPYSYKSYKKPLQSEEPIFLDGQEGELARLRNLWSIEAGLPDDLDWQVVNVQDELVQNVGVVFALDSESRVVGFGTLNKSIVNTDEVVFALAYVEEQHRQSGIFKGITEKIIETAISVGARTIKAEPSDYGDHINFMMREGFKQAAGEIGNALTLRKRL